MEAYYVTWVWLIWMPTRGCFTCRLPFINFKVLITTEGKTILTSKVAFNPDQSLRHDKHCQDKQSSLEMLDLCLSNLVCSDLEKVEFLKKAKNRKNSGFSYSFTLYPLFTLHHLFISYFFLPSYFSPFFNHVYVIFPSTFCC
jgi:hypothetical protein